MYGAYTMFKKWDSIFFFIIIIFKTNHTKYCVDEKCKHGRGVDETAEKLIVSRQSAKHVYE